MSKYTTEVRFICENAAGLSASEGYNTVNQTLDACWDKVFNFDFPVFDETYRGVLCKKILKHYYTREIAHETVGLWKLHLDARLNEIMPYYNKLYASEVFEFNPLYDVDITTTHERTGNTTSTLTGTGSDTKESSYSETDTGTRTNSGTETVQETDTSLFEQNTTENGESNSKTNDTQDSTSTTENTRANTRKYSDTPQGSLENVENGTYLTNATVDNETGTGEVVDSKTGESTTEQTVENSTALSGNGTDTKSVSKTDGYTLEIAGQKSGTGSETVSRSSTENNTVNSTEDYVTRVSGKQSGVSYAKMLMEFRDTILNIDMMIINALGDLFFGLW